MDAYYKFRKALYNTDQGHVVEKSLPDFSKFIAFLLVAVLHKVVGIYLQN